jgi:hypothetical protein
MNDSSSSNGEHLRTLVERYRVLWSILPKQLPEIMCGHRIGFEIELWGTHNHPSDAWGGECSDCSKAVEALNEIATHIAPAHCPFRTRGGNPVDTRAKSSPRSGFGRRMRLGVEVVCRNGYQAIDSPCDSACLGAMRERLIELGARRI